MRAPMEMRLRIVSFQCMVLRSGDLFNLSNHELDFKKGIHV